MVTVHLPPPVQPTLLPTLCLCPRRPTGHQLPGLWVPVGLSWWEEPATDQSVEGERGWLPSCGATGDTRRPPSTQSHSSG